MFAGKVAVSLVYANLVQKFRLSEENTNVFALLSEKMLSNQNGLNPKRSALKNIIA